MKITNTKQKQCMPHMHVCLSPCSGHRCVPSHSLCRYTGLLWHYIDWKGPRWHHSHILKESPTCCQKLRETSYPLTAQVKWHHLYNSFLKLFAVYWQTVQRLRAFVLLILFSSLCFLFHLLSPHSQLFAAALCMVLLIGEFFLSTTKVTVIPWEMLIK